MPSSSSILIIIILIIIISTILMISSSPSFVSAVVRNCGPDGNLIIENEIFTEELELENTKDGCDVRLFNVQAPIIRVEQAGRGNVVQPNTKYHFENIYCNNHPQGSDFQNCIRFLCGINNADVTVVMKNISFDPETATNTKLMIRMLEPLRAMKLLEVSDCLFVFKATTSAANMMTHALFAFADNVNGPSKIHFFNNTMFIPSDAPPMFLVAPCVIALGIGTDPFEFRNVELFLVESNSMIVEQHQFAAGNSLALFSVLRALFMPMSRINNMTLHRNRVISRTASPMVAAHSVQFNIFCFKAITGNFNFYFRQNTIDIYNPMEISAGGMALDIMSSQESGISDATQTSPINNIIQFSDNNRIQFHKGADVKIPGTILNQLLSQISIFKLQLPINMVNTVAVIGNNSIIVDSTFDTFSPTISCLNLQGTIDNIENLIVDQCNILLHGRTIGGYSMLVNVMALIRNMNNVRSIRVENSKLLISNVSTGAVPGVMTALSMVSDVTNVQEIVLSRNLIDIRHAGEEETSSVSARSGMLYFSRLSELNKTYYEINDNGLAVTVANCNITFTHLAGLHRPVASIITIVRSEPDSISAVGTSSLTLANNYITVVDEEIVDRGSLISSPRGQSQPIVAMMYATTDFLASNPVITRTPWSFMFKDNSITFRGATRDTNPANFYSKVTVEIFALVGLTSSDGIANFTLDRNNADVIIGSQRIKKGGNLVLSFSIHVLRIRGGLNHGINNNDAQLIQTVIIITNNNISSRANTSHYASMSLLNFFEGAVPRNFAVKDILLENNIVSAVTKYPVVDYSMMTLMLAGRSFGIASKFESKKNTLYGNLLVPIGPQYCYGFGLIASGRFLEFLSRIASVTITDTSIHCDVVFPENENDVMSVVAESRPFDKSVAQRYNIGLFSTRGIITPKTSDTPTTYQFLIRINNCDATLGTSTANRDYLARNPDLISSGRIFGMQFPLLFESEVMDPRMLQNQDRFPLIVDISETRLHVRGCLVGTKTLRANLLALSSQNLRLSYALVSKNFIRFVVDDDSSSPPSEAIADIEIVEAETVAYSCPDNCSFDVMLMISDNVIELPRFRQAQPADAQEYGDYYAHFFAASSSNCRMNGALIMNGNEIRSAASALPTLTQITTVVPLYIGIAFLEGHFSASGTRSSLSFLGNRIDLTDTRLESTTKNIFVCVLCIDAKHLEVTSSTSANSYNIRLVRNAVLSSSTTQLSAPAGIAVNQNLFRLAVPLNDDGEVSSSINSSIFIDTFLIEDNQFRLAPSTSPSSSVVHIEVATLARKHTKIELLNNTFSSPPSPSSSNSFLNIVIPSSKEFNFINIIDFDLMYNRELEFSSSTSSLVHVNRFVENENEIRDALLTPPSSSSSSSSSLRNNLNIMLENNTLYDLTKGSKIAAASLLSSSDSSTSDFETLLQQLGTNTPAFVFEELNWTIKCNFFSNSAQRFFLKQSALAKRANTNHSSNRFHLLCDRFDMSPSPTKATISQTASPEETSTRSREITESISLHANSTTKSESSSHPLSVSSSINTLSSSSSESFHENPPKYATFNQVVPPSMLSAVSIISLATMDPSSISFMNKMRMMATICGKDGVPFLPPLSFESNPLGISLGEGRESGDDTSDYRGALLGNSVFLLSFLVIHAAIIVPLFMWYHNKFKVPKKKTNQDDEDVRDRNTNNYSGEHSSGENGRQQQKKKESVKNNNSNRKEEKTKEEEQEEKKKASDNPQELIKPFKSLPEASRSIRFPGIIHLPTRVLLSPTIFCIGVVFSIFGYKNPATFEESFTMQFYRMPDAVEMFALVLAFIFFIILLLIVLFYVTRSVSHREELSDRKLFFRAAKRGPCPAFTRRLAKIVAPEKSWPPTSALIQRYNDVVKRNSHPQYVPFDVFIEIIIALVNGIAAMAASEASCQAARIVSFICCLVHVIVVCCLNPFLSFSRRKIEPSLSFLSCAFSLVVLISYYVDSVTDKAVNDFLVVAAIVATMVSVESMVKFLVSNYITRCLMTKKEQLKSKGKLTVPQEELKKKKNNNNNHHHSRGNNNNDDDDEEEMLEQEYARRQRGGRGAANNSSVDNIHRLFDAGDLLSGRGGGNKNQLHGHYNNNNHIHLRQLQDPLLFSPPAPPAPKMTKGEKERIQKMKKDELKKMRRREVESSNSNNARDNNDENLLGESALRMSPLEKKNSRNSKTNNVKDRKR